MSEVADPLREFARATSNDKEVIAHIDGIADQIDREHERRMEQQAYVLRKAFCHYLGGVIEYYKHEIKGRG